MRAYRSIRRSIKGDVPRGSELLASPTCSINYAKDFGALILAPMKLARASKLIKRSSSKVFACTCERERERELAVDFV